MNTWKASAPANIALIKYMGKEEGNVSTNASLSMTLSSFTTSVELSLIEENDHRWEPLSQSLSLTPKGRDRYLSFFRFLCEQLSLNQKFLVRSGNNFPADAGLASSASSFAALTMAAVQAQAEIKGTSQIDILSAAKLSRKGSGSSCRSFISPWCRWENEEIRAVPSSLPPLVDLVLVAADESKKVTSSSAHQRVRTSALFEGRVERASIRLRKLEDAMKAGNLQQVAEESWAELWDMHSLFHTSQPPFFYFAPGTMKALRWAEDHWEEKGRGPITTIDAGPNVHFLVPQAEVEYYRREITALGFPVLESGS
jgi:diphosphomevalonate decarboxylase